MLHVCVSVCVCMHMCYYVLRLPRSLLLPPGHTGWTSEGFLSLCISITCSAFLLCQSAFLASCHLTVSLSLPNTPFLLCLLPRTDSIFLARSRTNPAQLIKLMHSYLDETIGFTPHRNSRSAGVLVSMLEAIKGVTFHDELPTSCISQIYDKYTERVAKH